MKRVLKQNTTPRWLQNASVPHTDENADLERAFLLADPKCIELAKQRMKNQDAGLLMNHLGLDKRAFGSRHRFKRIIKAAGFVKRQIALSHAREGNGEKLLHDLNNMLKSHKVKYHD